MHAYVSYKFLKILSKGKRQQGGLERAYSKSDTEKKINKRHSLENAMGRCKVGNDNVGAQIVQRDSDNE